MNWLKRYTRVRTAIRTPTNQPNQAAKSNQTAGLLARELINELRKVGVGGDQGPAFRAAATALSRCQLTYADMHGAFVDVYKGHADAARLATQLTDRVIDKSGIPSQDSSQVGGPVGSVTRQTAVDTSAAASHSDFPQQQTSHFNAEERSPVDRQRQAPPSPTAASPLQQQIPRPVQRQVTVPQSASQPSSRPMAKSTNKNEIKLYDKSVFAEAATTPNGSFSVVMLGDRDTLTSSSLRGFLRLILNSANVSKRPIIDIVDLHGAASKIGWNGFDAAEKVTNIDFSVETDEAGREPVAVLAEKVAAIANEIRKRRRLNASNPFEKQTHYVFAVDGWCEYGDFFSQYTPSKQLDHPHISSINRNLGFILQHGPDVKVTTIITARDHTRVLSDREILHNTRVLALGRTSQDYQGGYNAIDRLLEDSAMVPSKLARSKFARKIYELKENNTPIVLALAGGLRVGQLPDMSAHQKAPLYDDYRQLPNF